MSIWLEVRISQGHNFGSPEEVKTTDIVERALDVDPQQSFCEADANLMFCYVRIDEARIPAGRFEFWRSRLSRRFSDEVGLSFDTLHVVDEAEVAEFFPQVVR